MDGAVHTSSSAKCAVRGIHNRVHRDFRDIPQPEFDSHAAIVKEMPPADALVLFDIDGTLIRRAGPHHREALVAAVRRATGIETTIHQIPTQGMLDRDILARMLRDAGVKSALIREHMPEIVRRAQTIYVRSCPNLEGKVCPGVRAVLGRLNRRGVPAGLVTGNLTRIGWKKMEHAGLRSFFQFGAFAEMASSRAGLVRIALQYARRQGLIHRESKISLVGDHHNDIAAARRNGIQSIAVATGVVPSEDLAACAPDLLLPDLRSLRLRMLF
jgi:phosphoglycolate phosphatase